MGRRERLQKILAGAGVASRRNAEALIRDGRVSVDGVPAALGDSADPQQQRVTVDGEPLRRERLAYWLVYKPRGVLSAAHDSRGRPLVVDLVPERETRLYPVGRLDRESEGLVLLTNDGALTQALLHPSRGHEREYRVTVRGRLSDRDVRSLLRGVSLADGPGRALRVTRLRPAPGRDTTTCHLVLGEGRKRQIRRMLDALGHPVLRLIRVRLGPLRLGSLETGAARRLSGAERAVLIRLWDAGSGPAASPAGPGRGARRRPRASSKRSRRSDPSN